MSDDKLFGTVQLINGRYHARLSRTADPSRKWIDLQDPSMSRSEAKQLAHDMSRAMIEKGLAFPKRLATSAGVPKNETVEQWSERWMADRVARHILETDRHDRGRLKEHVFPVIGSFLMTYVTRENIEGVVLSLDQKVVMGTLSHKTAHHVWGVVTKMFKDARRSKNPTIRVRPDDPTLEVEGPEDGEEKAKAFLYPSEFLQLITSEALTSPTASHVNVLRTSLRWRRVFVLATYMHLRAGELRPLRWEDVSWLDDKTRAIVHIHHATKRDTGGKQEKRTKTGVTRKFEVEARLIPLLRAMWDESSTKAGRIIDMPPEGDLSSRLKKYLQWAKVDREDLFADDDARTPITFRDLRATGITWRALRGDDPLKIQRAAGHKSLNTTQIYIRAAEDLGRNVGEPFPELPTDLVGSWSTAGLRPVYENANYVKEDNYSASPAGFEPAYQG